MKTCTACDGTGKALVYVMGKGRVVSVYMCTTNVFCYHCRGTGKQPEDPNVAQATQDWVKRMLQ